MAAYKEQYYNLPEEELQGLITKAKLGSGEAQGELLKVFNNFLTKYVTMLFYGKYNLHDYDIRRFVALFIKDSNVRRYLLRNKLSPQGLRHVHEDMNRINGMVQRYGDEEDIRQTVSMTFLQCVTRYKPAQSKIKPDEVVPFKGYIYSYFFYLLKKNVDAFLIDQLGRKTYHLLGDDEFGDEDSDDDVFGFHAPAGPGVEETLGTDEVDEFWVSGDTAMWPFNELSQQERQLIKWRYIDGYRSSEIAEKITEHPNTVREHFNRIRLHIRDILGDEELAWMALSG